MIFKLTLEDDCVDWAAVSFELQVGGINQQQRSTTLINFCN
jgi:hypothetical protein